MTKIDEQIFSITSKILELTGFDAKVEVNEKKEKILVGIDTTPAGLLIGRRGQNLTALERILAVLIYALLGKSVLIQVDIAGFREKREQVLESLISKAISQVLESNQPQFLSELTAAERRTVHLEVAKHQNLTSESSGTGANRVLIIRPK